jgi:hypothetical protein
VCFIILCVRRGCKVLLCPSVILLFLSFLLRTVPSLPFQPYELLGAPALPPPAVPSVWPCYMTDQGCGSLPGCGARFVSKYIQLNSKECQPSSFLSKTNEMLVLHILTGIRLLICFRMPNCSRFICEMTFCISFRYSTVQNDRQENTG